MSNVPAKEEDDLQLSEPVRHAVESEGDCTKTAFGLHLVLLDPCRTSETPSLTGIVMSVSCQERTC